MVKLFFLLGVLAVPFLELAQADYNVSTTSASACKCRCSFQHRNVFNHAPQSQPKCSNNIVTYHGNGGAPGSKGLKFYCTNEKNYADVIILTFVDKRDSDGQPMFSSVLTAFSSTVECGVKGNCASLGKEVAYCQSIGKTILLSIGGAEGVIVLKSASDAQDFATKVWNAYLGGRGSRPFGKEIKFDGVDLDIETGPKSSLHWGDFTTKLRSLYPIDKSKQYLISGAPQPEPIESKFQVRDMRMPRTSSKTRGWTCVLCKYGKDTLTSWEWWDSWATGHEKDGHNSKNRKVKLIYGLPGSPSKSCADTGYRTPAQVKDMVSQMKSKFPASFGGGGTWDDAWSFTNKKGNDTNFLQRFKKALGPCSKSSPGTISNITAPVLVPPRASINNAGPYVIIAVGEGESSKFQIKILADDALITSKWKLTLPKNSRVVWSSRGVVNVMKKAIEISSVPSEEKPAVGSIRFTVETKRIVRKIKLSRAKFVCE
ncbi:glycoside hydrolase superfamily [Jimgerdemannia flammicorona]|uniref:chitinase n=1 Tax=Jimgerdemannia flammicorona TaxID=994334 RepID=A0A433D423_9FUNG|nr:glycoside hydrolase superfamily [Jimgerdemannia flammicorona]